VSPGTSAFILHLLSVFGAAFATQMVASGVAGVHTWPALLALVCAAAAAGLVATIHLVLGLIPNLNVTLTKFLGSSDAAQVVTSVLAVFLTTFGAQLAIGASQVASVGTLFALIVAGITASGTAVVHYVIGLVPVPTPASSQKAVTVQVQAHVVTDVKALAAELHREIESILAKKTVAKKAAK